jgi:hypothetical protein
MVEIAEKQRDIFVQLTEESDPHVKMTLKAMVDDLLECFIAYSKATQPVALKTFSKDYKRGHWMQMYKH